MGICRGNKHLSIRLVCFWLSHILSLYLLWHYFNMIKKRHYSNKLLSKSMLFILCDFFTENFNKIRRRHYSNKLLRLQSKLNQCYLLDDVFVTENFNKIRRQHYSNELLMFLFFLGRCQKNKLKTTDKLTSGRR